MKAQAAKKGGKGGKTATFFVFTLFVHSTKCLRILPPLSITWLQQPADFYFHVWYCYPWSGQLHNTRKEITYAIFFFFQNKRL